MLGTFFSFDLFELLLKSLGTVGLYRELIRGHVTRNIVLVALESALLVARPNVRGNTTYCDIYKSRNNEV